jgi:transposase
MEIDTVALPVRLEAPPASPLPDSPEPGAKREAPTLCQACPFKLEIFEARQQAGYWKSKHQQAREREVKLQQEVEKLKAEVKKLKRQLFGQKSEKSSAGDRDGRAAKQDKSPRKRGQQPGQPGPRRRDTSQLDVKEEHYTLGEEQCRCSQCGLPFVEGPGSEVCEVIEIEVKAHKRRIRRQRYQPTCQCDHLPGIVTAAGPPKLIPKGRYGVSLWVTILLDKYAFLRPTHRLLEELRTYGIDLSLGTVTGGLKRLAPLFEPIQAEITRHNLSEELWHADETSWLVFIPFEGKVGPRWKLWVFQSRSAVDFVLDPTRKARVAEEYFQGVERGVLVVDRYSAYKAMAQVKEGKILLGFCWAHVRRDFLGVAKDWPGHEPWGLSWVEAIGELYHLNGLRLKAATPEEFASREEALRAAVEGMKTRREQELNQPELHPVCRKVLESLRNHWQGLTRFVANPQIPMDNNRAERSQRNPVCCRKQFSGSSALWSGHLAATLFGLFATLELWQLNPRKWLSAYLQACAEHGGKAPKDAARWLPWNLCDEQRAAWAALPRIHDTS